MLTEWENGVALADHGFGASVILRGLFHHKKLGDQPGVKLRYATPRLDSGA